jgi:Kef-type K+ transport system membrane component KefB
MHHGTTLLTDISLSIIFATLLAHITRLLKQPLILGYILGGVLLGKEMGFSLVTSEESIELISEIGLILLLFIIGLEINLKELAKMGSSMFVLGVVQFFGCLALSMIFFSFLGYTNSQNQFNLLYLGIAFSLSSTLIVVKLLQDKVEISTISGKFTVGILVLQDIWAILFMGVQPNLLKPELLLILKSVVIIILLIILSFVFSKYILHRIYSASANRPELVLLTSITWCFLITGIADKVGLSKEMGSLVAGMSIAAFPYGNDVISKLIGIRDFFVTLFFVSLGLKVQFPTWQVLSVATIGVILVLFTRLLTITPVMLINKQGLRNSFVTSLNLAQVSEFSLVILSLGLGFSHITSDLQALILSTMILSSVASTYIIMFNHEITNGIVYILGKIGLNEKMEVTPKTEDSEKKDIILLGFYRIGEMFVNHIYDLKPEFAERMLVVDYNPKNKEKLKEKGFDWHYADLANLDSLSHLGIEDASLIICSISDIFLKGTNNARLLANLSKLAPNAKYILTTDDLNDKKKLLEAGAYKVIVPSEITGEFLFDLVFESLRKI